MKQRVITGICLIAILLGLVIWGPAWSHGLILLVTALLGGLEMRRMTERFFSDAESTTKENNATIPASTLLFSLGTGATCLVCLWFFPFYPVLAAALPLFIALSILRAMWSQDHTRALGMVGMDLLNFVYPFVLWGFMVLLLRGMQIQSALGSSASADQPPQLWTGSQYLILYLIVAVKCTDMGAYFTGSFLGKHPCFPALSPKKTWEGCLGGVIISVLASSLFLYAFNFKIGPLTFTWTHAILCGTCLAVLGIFADLAESIFKRSAGVKDSGTLIPGMGGMLDVIDSLLIPSAFLYFYGLLMLAS